MADTEQPQSHFEPGTVVNERYLLVRLLGVGGMGSVWLAHDRSLDTDCAVKLIEAEKAKDSEIRIRFEREAKASAQLRGPHVVDVFDYGVWEDTPFIAMEYLDGEDLAGRLRRLGRLDPESAYRIVAQVARALSRAAAQGVVHRDLKPENIMLIDADGDEVAKVLDFGIAKHEEYSIRDNTTMLGSFLGTPYYMSPEQARGEAVDPRSDLWALGVIAFQCLTGKPPFFSESLGKLLGQICYDPLPYPTQFATHLPQSINDWWARAAERDREKRFQYAAELADGLAHALGIAARINVPIVSRRSSTSRPPGASVESEPPHTKSTGQGNNESYLPAFQTGGPNAVWAPELFTKEVEQGSLAPVSGPDVARTRVPRPLWIGGSAALAAGLAAAVLIFSSSPKMSDEQADLEERESAADRPPSDQLPHGEATDSKDEEGHENARAVDAGTGDSSVEDGGADAATQDGRGKATEDGEEPAKSRGQRPTYAPPKQLFVPTDSNYGI